MADKPKATAKRKPPRKTRPPAKRKPPAPPVTTMPWDDEENDKRLTVAKLSAIFWTEFVSTTTCPVQNECLDTAIEKHGALANITSKWKQLKPAKPYDPKNPNVHFEAALECCRRAAIDASERAALKNPQKPEIDPPTFTLAWEHISGTFYYLAKRRDRAKKKDDDKKPVKIEAYLC